MTSRRSTRISADEPLADCLAVAREAGFEPMFEEVARKELTMNGRAWEALRRRSEGRRQGSTDGIDVAEVDGSGVAEDHHDVEAWPEASATGTAPEEPAPRQEPAPSQEPAP